MCRRRLFGENVFDLVKRWSLSVSPHQKFPSRIGRYLDFYNTRRPHQSLDGIAPDQAYFKQFCSEIRSQRSLTRVCSRRAKERATAEGTFSTRTAEERSR